MLTKKDKKKRYNKRPSKITGHEFSGWGAKSEAVAKEAFSGSNLGGSISSIASGVEGIVGAGIANAQIADTSAQEKERQDRQNWQSDAADNNSLLAEMASDVALNENISLKSIRGVTPGQMVGNTFKGALQGASAGASVGGPWGAVAGALAGLGSGIAGIFAGRKKAKRKVDQLNAAAKAANLAKAQTLTAKVGALDQQADARDLAAYAAYGGDINTPKFPMFPSEVTEFNEGGSHEENPYDGIPQGIAPDGMPNLVEEGEVKYNDYIFSDRLMVTKEDKKRYKFLKGKTYADAAKAIKRQLGVDERPNDPFTKADLDEQLNVLSMLQEEKRRERGLEGENRMMYKRGGPLFGEVSKKDERRANRIIRRLDPSIYPDEEGGTKGWASITQAAPAIGSAIGTVTQLFNKPKYEHANELQSARENFVPISYTPITQKMTYTPFDTNYYGNKLAAQAGATRRAIREQSSTNPYASTAALLSADYNAQTQMGDLYRKAEEYNLAQREKVDTFNRATDSANAEMAMKAQQLNSAMRDKIADRQFKRDLYAAQMKMADDAAWSNALSAGLTTTFDNIGDIAKQKIAQQQAKDAIRGQVNAAGYDYDENGKPIPIKKAHGGKINTKKKYKRGFTL